MQRLINNDTVDDTPIRVLAEALKEQQTYMEQLESRLQELKEQLKNTRN